jgi:hypothetical protein
MSRTVPLLVRLVLLAIFACAGAMPAIPAAPPAASPAAQNSDALAGVLPEVRIRRLHLVRPDLILYPLAYEVLC